MKMSELGGYAFILGVIIAVIASFISLDAAMVTGVLIVLGLIVGFLNVTDKETIPFLAAGIALVLTATALAPLGNIVGMEFILRIVQHIALFVSPATLIVALLAILRLTKD